MFTQDEYNAHLQPTRVLHTRIDLLNSSGIVVDRLEGISLEGSVSANADSLIRRTATLKMALSSNLLPSQESLLWITNRIRPWIGLEDYFGTIHYYCQGTYMIKNPSVDISVKGRTISIELADKMYALEGMPIETILRLDAGIPISDAVKTVTQSIGGENNLLIDTHPYTIPSKQEFKPDQSVLDVEKTLRDLYMNWECFYNLEGYFVFRKIPNHLNDPVVWDFADQPFILTSKSDFAYDNIKNHVKVIGRTLDNGTTVSVMAENNDVSSPFSIAKIGKRSLVPPSNDKYFTVEQCQADADYNLFKHGNYNEKVSISCAPIYFLDVNHLVNFNSPEDGMVGKYCVTTLTVPLDHKSEMSFTAYKIY